MTTVWTVHIIGSLIILFLGGNFIVYQHARGKLEDLIDTDIASCFGILFAVAATWPLVLLMAILYGAARLIFLPAQLVGKLVEYVGRKGPI